MNINDSGSGGGGGGEETAASSITAASPVAARGTAVNKETTTNKKPQQQQQQRQLCRFYFQNNKCSYGSSCRFSHDKPNGDMTREEILQTIPCPHYSRGYCAFGDQCELLHHCPTTHQELQKQPLRQEQKHEQQEQQKQPQQQNHQHHQQENNDDTLLVDTTCGICLENVYNTKQCKFGLLSCCDHVFCFSCLMQWRTRNSNSSSHSNSNNNNRNNNNSEISSSTRRVCPTCRKSSNYVVPSSTFPTNSTEKTNIVTNYKHKCSHIKCKKYTVGKLGSCPFGRDCFYAHYDENGIDMKKDDMTMQELFEERERHRLRRDRNRNNRESDLDMIAEMLMMMALQRQFGGGGGGGRRGGGRRGERRSRGDHATDDDHEDEDEDDELGIDDFLLHLLSMAGDNDMPFPLQHLFGAMAASAFDGEEEDGSSPFNRNDDEDDESLDSMPPLEEIVEHDQSDLAIALEEIGAEFEEEENNSDDNSMPPLEDLNNDDDNSMPPLEDIE
ncbi:hypothetical protein ACHAWC_008898 [Mediolabrus comicus]